MNAQADELIERQVLHAFGSQSLDVLRRDAVDAKRNQLIGRRVRETQVADIAGNRAISAAAGETSGFASLPYDRFAIGPMSGSSALAARSFSPSRQNP